MRLLLVPFVFQYSYSVQGGSTEEMIGGDQGEKCGPFFAKCGPFLNRATERRKRECECRRYEAILGGTGACPPESFEKLKAVHAF